MGPPPFGDGNLAGIDSGWQVVVPSMGPPPFGDGNSRLMEQTPARYPCLQWGHRLSAMETRQVVGGHHLFAAPSMGPPPFGDGNAGLHSCQVRCTLAFNGATAFRRWKHGLNRTSCSSNNAPSMGPPPFGDGNAVPLDRGRVPPVPPSMGPPPFGDGNKQQSGVELITSQPSMGPPPFGDGNYLPMWSSPSPMGPFNGATAFRRWKPAAVTVSVEIK